MTRISVFVPPSRRWVRDRLPASSGNVVVVVVVTVISLPIRFRSRGNNANAHIPPRHFGNSRRFVSMLFLWRVEIFSFLAVRGKKRARISDLISFSRYEYRAVTIWLAVSLYLHLSLSPAFASIPFLPPLALSSFWHEVSSSDVRPKTRLRESRSKALRWLL